MKHIDLILSFLLALAGLIFGRKQKKRNEEQRPCPPVCPLFRDDPDPDSPDDEPGGDCCDGDWYVDDPDDTGHPI